MDFPDVFNLPEEQARDVMQAYVAGMMDEKESLVDLLTGLEKATTNSSEKNAYTKVLLMLTDKDSVR